MADYIDIDNIVTPTDWIPDVSPIKVIGVGGGGCNAVTYMYNQKVQGCNFIVCNTDRQALEKSNVPIKIQLGEGLGAGTNPTEGRNAAIESQDIIAEKLLTPETKMVFITAGMGGGTGTGASPVIAKMAKDRGILTVAVVTIPFKNEGDEAISKAIDGIHELQPNVDSLLIINNEKLYEYYGNLLVHEAFPHADEVLATAVRGITEIISRTGYINVDFKDVRNMMSGSGMALMGCGTGTGNERLEQAVKRVHGTQIVRVVVGRVHCGSIGCYRKRKQAGLHAVNLRGAALRKEAVKRCREHALDERPSVHVACLPPSPLS
jgi:cell division protein FtsZ